MLSQLPSTTQKRFVWTSEGIAFCSCKLQICCPVTYCCGEEVPISKPAQHVQDKHLLTTVLSSSMP